MQRVTRSSAVASLPAAPGSPSTPGYFTGGNPGLGQPATVPGYEWFNAVQEELIAAILDGGQTADAGVLTQLRASIRRLAGAVVTAVTGTISLGADAAGLVTVSVAGVTTITLPAANAAGGRALRFQFVRLDATANTVTIQRAGADTIEGQTSITLRAGARMLLVSDGASAWRLLSADARFSAMQGFTTSGTFVVPSGVYRVRVVCTGAGGGGSGFATANGGFGGGAGGTAIGWYDVTPGQSIAVTVGTGGTAGNGTVNAGGAGSSSSFGSFCSATGGGGGLAGGPGGAGGVGSGGSSNIEGGGGFPGGATIHTSIGGNGGGSFWGSGGRARSSGAGPGEDGKAFGSGGGAQFGGGGPAGAGAPGYVLVEW